MPGKPFAQAQAVEVDGKSYPTKTAAIMALASLNLSHSEIGKKIGSSTGSVGAVISQQRKKAARDNGRLDSLPNTWTAEKRDKVRRLFGTTMVYIAEAVQVPADELLTYVLHGVVPPSQAVRLPEDIKWVPPRVQLPAPPVLEAPTHCMDCAQPLVGSYMLCGRTDAPYAGARCLDCFGKSQCCIALGDDCSTVVTIDPPAPDEPEHVDADDMVVEPDRDDDEAALAALEDPTHCTSCGEAFAGQYLMCDEAEGAWCPQCFEATPCGREEHGAGCCTIVISVPEGPYASAKVVAPPPEHLWIDDPEAAFNILMLTDADVSLDVVKGWTPEQRYQAEEWAGAVHMSASDNDDIEVPPRPEFVPIRPLQIGRATFVPGVAASAPDWEDEDVPAGVDPATAPTLTIKREEPAPAPARFQATEKTAAGPVAAAAPPGALISVATGMFPTGRMVRLKREDGQYLHESLQGFTKDRKWAWDGTRQQFDAVKAQMPKVVAKLSFEVVV